MMSSIRRKLDLRLYKLFECWRRNRSHPHSENMELCRFDSRSSMDDREVVIASAVRTPFGKFDGLMRDIPSIDLGVMVLKEVVRRIDLDPKAVDEIYYGTCIPAEYASYLNVPARQITLLAGFPSENVSLTLDRACCSFMPALRLGYRAIQSGAAGVVVG